MWDEQPVEGLFMSNLTRAFAAIVELEKQGAMTQYAITAPFAYLFHAAETICCYQINVLVTWAALDRLPANPLTVEQIPLLFSVASTPLEMEAISMAVDYQYEGLQISVMAPEYLAALAYRRRDIFRIRASQLLEYDGVDMVKLYAICGTYRIELDVESSETSEPTALNPIIQRIFDSKRVWHHEQSRLPFDEKVGILLRMQRDSYPIYSSRGALEAYQKPWDIDWHSFPWA
jgi:hypothetical protein